MVLCKGIEPLCARLKTLCVNHFTNTAFIYNHPFTPLYRSLLIFMAEICWVMTPKIQVLFYLAHLSPDHGLVVSISWQYLSPVAPLILGSYCLFN